MYLSVLLHGHGDVASGPARAARPPSARTGRTRRRRPARRTPPAPCASSASCSTTTYGLSESSMPMCAMWLPIGPIENGTTYIVRPRMQPSNSRFIVARISAGATQLFVGPASSSLLAADERAVLDARDVGRVGAARDSCSGASAGLSFVSVPAATISAQRRVVLGVAAVAPDDTIGLRQERDVANPGEQPRMTHVGGRRQRRRRERTSDRDDSSDLRVEGGLAARDDAAAERRLRVTRGNVAGIAPRRIGQVALPHRAAPRLRTRHGLRPVPSRCASCRVQSTMRRNAVLSSAARRDVHARARACRRAHGPALACAGATRARARTAAPCRGAATTTRVT